MNLLTIWSAYHKATEILAAFSERYYENEDWYSSKDVRKIAAQKKLARYGRRVEHLARRLESELAAIDKENNE